ncbi:MAG: peroxide stress protein YaaA, partial [Planctomycetes bacterium]|nr:peroxide stress protein YaaA [Planctomycetota bacterium]
MLLLLSPAKKLHAAPSQIGGRASKPEFIDQAAVLINELRKLSATKLAKFMKLSPALAEQNVQRYENWNPKHRRPAAAPCILTFAGEVY